MNLQTNENLVAHWLDEPAPLLPLLHAFHDRDGYLSADAIDAVAGGLKIPKAELFATITFYHHFAREAPGQSAPRVCTGPICIHRGANTLLADLDKATAMPCAGRCDGPIPVIKDHQVLIGTSSADLTPTPSPLPRPNPGGYGECVFADIRAEGRATVAGYRQSGGYSALQLAIEKSPEELIEAVIDSQLAGRGGAGFGRAFAGGRLCGSSHHAGLCAFGG